MNTAHGSPTTDQAQQVDPKHKHQQRRRTEKWKKIRRMPVAERILFRVVVVSPKETATHTHFAHIISTVAQDR